LDCAFVAPLNPLDTMVNHYDYNYSYFTNDIYLQFVDSRSRFRKWVELSMSKGPPGGIRFPGGLKLPPGRDSFSGGAS
jgi:hypothetical protein